MTVKKNKLIKPNHLREHDFCRMFLTLEKTYRVEKKTLDIYMRNIVMRICSRKRLETMEAFGSPETVLPDINNNSLWSGLCAL